MTIEAADISADALLRAARQRLSRAGVETAALDACVLLTFVLGIDRTALIASPGRRVSTRELRQYDALIERRVRREPVSRIIGRREFYGLDFALVPETLDPRPDTETIIERCREISMIQARPGWPGRIVDLGTGTGAIVITLLTLFPQSIGIGTDWSFAAVRQARSNAISLGVGKRAKFVAGDWGAALGGGADLIVANPPYLETDVIAALSPEVAIHDPLLALDGGGDGLAAYRAIAQDVCRILAPDGWLVVEVGAGQAAAVKAIFEMAGLAESEFIAPVARDLGGIERVVCMQRPAKSSIHAKK